MRKIVPLTAMVLLYSVLAFAQNKKITGKVIDDTGKPIEGVSVVDKHSLQGTITDASGNFSLSVGNGTTVVFSAVGFGKKEVAVTEADVMNVTLAVVSAQLNEVVVTALGIKREKRALGYAVSTVEKKDLE